MISKIAILVGYFLVVLSIGFIARTRWKATPETYFLADRKLGALILLGTMVATNFSAFTVFGTSGAGYRDGYAFFPIMGFGTGFMALTFYILGKKIWEVGRDRGLVTPPELVGALYKNRGVSLLFSVIMIVFTIPYLALQPMAAGYVLEELVGLPYFYGCILITAIIAVYTLRGGMRAVAWTDVFQGVVMFILLLVSIILVATHFGGFAAANQKVMSAWPELFSRPGAQGKYIYGVWFSFMFLWFFSDPMFPQLFQRFFTAKNDHDISRIMLLYPLVCTVVFFLPISVGVMGRLSFPDLVGKQADRILPMVLTHISGDSMAALVMAAGLAALMSTMDSQLLTLSSIFTRDILPGIFKTEKSENSIPGRIFVFVLSLAGLALAYNPPDTILQIAAQTFTGLAVLFPTVIFALYLKRVFALSAFLSIIVGESLVVAFYLKWISPAPFLPVVWVIAATFLTYLIVHGTLLLKEKGLPFFVSGITLPGWLANPYSYVFIALFALAMDFWGWGENRPAVFGLPLWMGYFVVLSALQTVFMYLLVRNDKKPIHADSGSG